MKTHMVFWLLNYHWIWITQKVAIKIIACNILVVTNYYIYILYITILYQYIDTFTGYNPT